jgi:hypothetical protein
MRLCYFFPVLAVFLAALLVSASASAQVYAAEDYPGYIARLEGDGGTIVNPDTLIQYATKIALDHAGRLLIAVQDGVTDVIRFDPVTQDVELLDPHVDYSFATGIHPDLGDDIYVLKSPQFKGDGGRQFDSWIGILRDGVGPADTAYVFPYQPELADIEIWPAGERAGNLLVMTLYEGNEIVEIERTEYDDFQFYQTVADDYLLPSNPTAFEILDNGDLLVLDYQDGLYYIDTFHLYSWEWGQAVGPGLIDMDIAQDGTIYIINAFTDSIERYDASGIHIPPNITGGLSNPYCIAARDYTPTPEGEDVLVEPGEDIEVTYEEVTQSGFTSAEVTSSALRVSPEGNYLPDYAVLPAVRPTEFNYVSLATDAIYEGLIQVDILQEGTRLFYASGVGDTFRDFTVVGSIDDARGTIPRFSELQPTGGKEWETGPTEVVLVDDTRQLSQVTLYKFRRMQLALEVPDNMPGGDPCPWEFIEWLQKYPRSAREYYDLSNYTLALSELAIMNSLIRSHAGWCIPDSSADPVGNLVAKLLAHSKTLMHSIELESGVTFTGIEEAGAISVSIAGPARGQCRLSLSGPVGARVTARIYSVSGRLVATVYDGHLPAGGETVVWNGVDATGRPIASGVYFARVESGSEVLTSKVVYIR